jgi:drug/metabolite transporter (DMT)-like permease
MSIHFTDTQRHGLGMLLVVGASLVLAAMNAGVKWLALRDYPALQISLFNGSFGLLSVFVWLLAKRNLGSLLRLDPLLAVYVPVFVAATFCLFYGFGHGHLGQISVIVAASPLVVAVLSFFFLGEKLSRWQGFLAVAGFIGIVVAIRPGGSAPPSLPEFVALAGTFGLAASQVLVRGLSRKMHTLAIIFYFYAAMVLTAACVVPLKAIAPSDLPVFIFCGLCDILALFLMYTAFRFAPPSIVTPFQYTNVLWSVLLGYLLWSETPTVWTVIGAAIIIAAGILFTHNVLQRKEPAPA